METAYVWHKVCPCVYIYVRVCVDLSLRFGPFDWL